MMHVALCGPFPTADVADLLAPEHAAAARAFPGMTGTAVARLARGLVTQGCQVSVVTTPVDHHGAEAEFDGDRINVVAVPRRPARDAMRDFYRNEREALASALQETGADLVHAHWTYEFELAAQDSALPHVTTARDAPITMLKEFRDAYRGARLATALRARPGIRHLAATSPYLAERWRREMLYRRPISLVPNPVPPLRVDRVPAAVPTVIEVADASRRKNIPRLLSAFARVRQELGAAELRLVGAGLGEEEELAAQARRRGLDDGVVFLGLLPTSSLAKEYSRAWVHVHAATEEAFGNTMLEALSIGLPVVAGARSGGPRFVLGGGRYGTLVDVSDVGALADAVSRALVAGPESVPAGTDEHLMQFSEERVTISYLDWYQNVLDEYQQRPEARSGMP